MNLTFNEQWIITGDTLDSAFQTIESAEKKITIARQHQPVELV